MKVTREQWGSEWKRIGWVPASLVRIVTPNTWLATVMAHMSGTADSRHTVNVSFKVKPSTQLFEMMLKQDPKMAARVQKELDKREAEQPQTSAFGTPEDYHESFERLSSDDALQDVQEAPAVQREEAVPSLSDESSSSVEGVCGSEESVHSRHEYSDIMRLTNNNR